MSASAFAFLCGIAYLGLGVAGMLPLFLAPPAIDVPETQFTFLYGFLFGLFPVNVVLTAIHMAVGAWGIAAGTAAASPERFSRVVAVFFGALALMGLVPEFNTFFGFVPLYGHDVWLHGLTAAAAAWFGWRSARPAARDRRRALDRRQQRVAIHTERRQRIDDRRRGYEMNLA